MTKYRLILLLSLLLLAASPAAAVAHAFLDEAAPRVGSVVKVAPTSLRIRFTQPIEAAFSHIKLIGADGEAVELGEIAVDPSDQNTLIATVVGRIAPGRYEVQWAVVSVDTHRTNGHYTFTFQP